MASDIAGVDNTEDDVSLHDTYQDIYNNNFDQDIYAEYNYNDDITDTEQDEINELYDIGIPPQDKEVIDLTNWSDEEDDDEITPKNTENYDETSHVKQENTNYGIEEQVADMEKELNDIMEEIRSTESTEKVDETNTQGSFEEKEEAKDVYTTQYGQESKPKSTYTPSMEVKR